MPQSHFTLTLYIHCPLEPIRLGASEMTVKRKNFSPGWIGFLIGIGILYSAFWVTSSAAQTASLLPPAIQQFFSSSGAPLNNGKVWFYEVGTSTLKNVYTSSAATTPYTNPITLNAGGKPPGSSGIYGIGLYRQLVKDSAGNTVWDAVTAPGGGGGTPTLVGDGNSVGTILTWAGLVAPNQYAFTYGQEIARSTYPDFYIAITQRLNVICTSASNILTGVSDTTQIKIGSPVELSACVVAGTTVTAKTGSTVTLSNSSSVSINSTAIFFPWGNGNGSTTFNVPNLNGTALIARNNMGGTPSANLTSTYYGANPDALGAVGGSQSKTLALPNLPPFTPAGTVSVPTITSVVSGGGLGGTGNSGFGAGGTQTVTGPTSIIVTSTSTAPVFTGSVSGGTSVPLSVVQPSTTINYVIKITPDAPISISTVVTSLGGMTGVISCDTTFKCLPVASVNTIGLATQSNNTLLANVSGGVAQPTPLSFTRTGNTWALVTSTGSLTNGHCVSIDSTGNYVDAGGPCTTGGGGGTVTAGTAGQVAGYAVNGSTVVGVNVPTSVSNSDNSLTISPTTGAVIASINTTSTGLATNNPLVGPSSVGAPSATGNGCNLTAGNGQPVLHKLMYTDNNWCTDMNLWSMSSREPSGLMVFTVGGSPTAGDVLILFLSSNSGTATQASYTVQPGDTTTTIAQGLVASIQANPLLYTPPIGGYGSGALISFVTWLNNNQFAFDYSSVYTLFWRYGASGAATETLTANGGWFAGQLFVGGTSTGSANSQTVAAPTGWSGATGNSIKFTAGFSNSGSVTLAVGPTSFLLRKYNASGTVVNTAAGDVVAGQTYVAVINGICGCWIINMNSTPIPITSSTSFVVAPNNWDGTFVHQPSRVNGSDSNAAALRNSGGAPPSSSMYCVSPAIQNTNTNSTTYGNLTGFQQCFISENAVQGHEKMSLFLQGTAGHYWIFGDGLRSSGGSCSYFLEPGCGAPADLGPGTINLAGGLYLNGTAYTNPDYVLEKFYTGKIEKFKDNPGAKHYAGVLPLDKLENYMKENLALPGVPHDRPVDVFERADILLQQNEEQAIYIVELNKRLTAIEACNKRFMCRIFGN